MDGITVHWTHQREVTITYDRDGAFGGFKNSGIGREFGATGLAQYFEYKTIAA
ncbi:aldehyde dehydrogenase family protein [Kibdelosporangium philippinense]|uniref:aldehyde dehydrogenase family protein n=1 Tax=Kibdelosporangium philippinense TaxID=211113 RepID=UPI003558A80F